MSKDVYTKILLKINEFSIWKDRNKDVEWMRMPHFVIRLDCRVSKITGKITIAHAYRNRG